MGPYQSAAREIHAAGLNPLPIWSGAKQPAVKWRHWQDKRMPAGLVERFRCSHADANIGTTTGGISGVLVVDVDAVDESLWEQCIARFGDTPLKVRTGSGKLHLWYAAPTGVRNAQRIDGMPVDIRGDGGVVVLPPSLRDGGGEYQWMEGHLGLVKKLPLPKVGALPAPRSVASSRPGSGARGITHPGAGVGERNTALFRKLLLVATACRSWEELLERARDWNDALEEPLGGAEVDRTAASVWRYKVEGTLLTPGGAGNILIPRQAVAELAIGEPDSVALLALLRLHHAGRRDSFILSVRAMAASISWSERRLRHARQVLVDHGLLARHYPGGREGQPARFTFES